MRTNLLSLRQSKGFSQKDFAKYIDVSVPTISRYETGKRTPSLEMAHKLAAALDCRIEDLFEEVVPAKQ